MKMNNNLNATNIYLQSILQKPIPWEEELMTYAEENRVPIIEPVSMNFITTLLKLAQPIRILEIGTAIGYSALSMHHALPSASITTLERNEEMIIKATENIAKFSLTNQIELITGDALDSLPELIDQNKKFDFIFIDAAKGQYKKFFEYAMHLQSDKGIILTDNVLFKGYVAEESTGHKRFQKLAKKINSYNNWLMENEKYSTSIIPIGDGIALSIKN